MLFYDIEAFPHYWCVVVVDDHGIKDTTNVDRYVFEDVDSLRSFYKEHRNTHTWVGYNSRQYDAPMLRFIMLGLDPYRCSQDLIELGKKWFEFGYNITQAYKRIPLRNYDCVLLNKGLKKLEGFRGSSIIESDIDWNLDRPLTREEKDKTVGYCTHDTLECRKVFYDTIQEYQAHEGLIEAFDIDPVNFSKSKAQLSALILNAQKKTWFDEWDFEIVDTLRLDKYKEVKEWYLDKANHNYKAKLEIDIAGVPHVFAWGGIHGARQSYNGEGIYINMDVDSYYPALMIEYNFLSRNVLNPAKFEEIRDYRLVLKAKKDPRQLPYKIVLNGTYGAMKDKFNALFDPKQANNVCVNGQLLLLDLIEKVEGHCQLIQSNTDGILVKVDTEEQAAIIKTISQEWSKRTRMGLSYEPVAKIFQKDVNNYLTVSPDGDIKSKGAFAKTWLRKDENNQKVDDLTDYDLVILREAITNYMSKGIPIETTINECKDLRKFQKIVMVSRKYSHSFHGIPTLVKWKENYQTKKKFEVNDDCLLMNERHIRVFASSDVTRGGIFKVHAIRNNVNKVSDTPDHAFIVNTNIEGVSTDDYPELDKEYYIKMAKSRIKGFFTKTA
jgi:hypothetical protein